ncbi:hypothetical protein NR792_13865 [Corallococcus exercitus]
MISRRASISGTETRTRPRGVRTAWASSDSASRSSVRARTQRSWKRAPCSVRCMRRVVRWKRRVPRRSSSRATLLLAAEGVMPSARAAEAKLPVSATRAKTPMADRLSMRSSRAS